MFPLYHRTYYEIATYHGREMSRSRRVFALSLPLMTGGSLIAHTLSYRIAFPDAQELERDLAATGHGYLDHVAFLLAPAVAIALVALVLAVLDGARRRTTSLRLPAWPFALLPLLGFAAQEHLERLFHGGGFPWHAAGERTFDVGLLLQLPFALAAYLAARTLLAGARRLGQALARRRRTRPRVAAVPLRRPVSIVRLLRPALLALGYGVRGPPLAARS
jgi:hypothetical protein